MEQGTSTDIWYPKDSGKTHFHQVNLWSIMSDRPSYTIHPQTSGVLGSGCMDFCIDRLNPSTDGFKSNWKFSQILKALKPMIICFIRVTLLQN